MPANKPTRKMRQPDDGKDCRIGWGKFRQSEASDGRLTPAEGESSSNFPATLDLSVRMKKCIYWAKSEMCNLHEAPMIWVGIWKSTFCARYSINIFLRDSNGL